MIARLLFAVVLVVAPAATPAWAAAPVVASSTSGADAAATLSRTYNYPAGIASGDLVIFLSSCRDSTNTMTWDAEVTLLFAETQAAATSRVWLEGYYRRSDGTEGADITVETSSSDMCAYIAYRITGHHAVTNPESADGSQATTENPDPPSLNPSGWGAEETLWIVVTGYPDSADTVTAYPTNYSSNQINAQTGNGNESSIGAATRAANTASEDPAVFTISDTHNVSSATIAVRPAASSGSGICMGCGMSSGGFMN